MPNPSDPTFSTNSGSENQEAHRPVAHATTRVVSIRLSRVLASAIRTDVSKAETSLPLAMSWLLGASVYSSQLVLELEDPPGASAGKAGFPLTAAYR